MNNFQLKKLRDEFSSIDSEINRLYIRRGELAEQCPHIFDGENFATCSICGREFGTNVCNLSPDKVCHSVICIDENKHRYIELMDKTKYYELPSDIVMTGETCIFCGNDMKNCK